MAEQDETEPRPEKTNFAEQIRRVALAGVGALVMAQEEMADFVYRLVERGELEEHDARGVVREIFARHTPVGSIEAQVNARFADLLKSMSIPLADDVRAISTRIERLENTLAAVLAPDAPGDGRVSPE